MQTYLESRSTWLTKQNCVIWIAEITFLFETLYLNGLFGLTMSHPIAMCLFLSMRKPCFVTTFHSSQLLLRPHIPNALLVMRRLGTNSGGGGECFLLFSMDVGVVLKLYNYIGKYTEFGISLDRFFFDHLASRSRLIPVTEYNYISDIHIMMI